MNPGGGTGCRAAELCFEDSGTVSPRKSHPKETAVTYPDTTSLGQSSHLSLLGPTVTISLDRVEPTAHEP